MGANGEKEVSLQKIEANRKNALRSTGPKTPAGKRAVQWNALKHGLLAKEVVIRGGDGQESAGQFRKLFKQLRQELGPQGILEEMLVEKIAVSYWRLRRVLQAEMGEVRGELDTVEKKQLDSQAWRFSWAQISDSALGRLKVSETSMGLRFLIELLDEADEEARATGELSENTFQQLGKYFGETEGSFPNQCRAAIELSRNETGQGDSRGKGMPAAKRAILEILEEKRKNLFRNLLETEKQEWMKLNSTLDRLSLPSKDAVDKILRYEAAIERQIYRAMDQLDRLQRRRQGEAVPPPLNVGLSQN